MQVIRFEIIEEKMRTFGVRVGNKPIKYLGTYKQRQEFVLTTKKTWNKKGYTVVIDGECWN